MHKYTRTLDSLVVKKEKRMENANRTTLVYHHAHAQVQSPKVEFIHWPSITPNNLLYLSRKKGLATSMVHQAPSSLETHSPSDGLQVLHRVPILLLPFLPFLPLFLVLVIYIWPLHVALNMAAILRSTLRIQIVSDRTLQFRRALAHKVAKVFEIV
jgi:hypothetical protein